MHKYFRRASLTTFAFFINTIFGILKEGDEHLSYINSYFNVIIRHLMATSCWKRGVYLHSIPHK